MSVNSIIGSNNKIFDNLLPNPYPYPAYPSPLGAVLISGNQAGDQDIIGVNNLQVDIVDNPLLGGSLTIGGAGQDLRIQGATLKGSLLSGDGTSTNTIPLGTNGYVLTADSTDPVGVKWASAGGAGVASITAGANIGVNNAIPTAPVVSLLSPLTTSLNMGLVAITDSSSATGTSGQYLTAGTGAKTLWATLPTSVASIANGTNTNITGTATVPIVNLNNPLTSGLGLGTQSITGTSGSITLVNAGSTNTIQSISVRVADTTTVATNSLLSKTGLVVAQTGQTITYGPSNIVKTGTALGISSTGGAINMVGTLGITMDSGGASPVSITQPALSQTKLRTNLTNQYFYPDAVITNGNSNLGIVPVPEVPEGRLTCVNYGVIENNTWSPYGDTFDYGSGVRTLFRDSLGKVWTSTIGSNIIQIRDEAYTSPDLQNITLTGLNAEAYVIYEYNGFVYIGGSFTQIDANPQFQYNITRFQINLGFPYTFSPMYDTTNVVEGVNGSVYAIQSVGGIYGGEIVIGGNFTDTTPSSFAPVNYICLISNSIVNTSGNQNFSQFNGGTNNTVNTLHYGAGSYLWVGGDFTSVNSGSLFHNYCSAFDVAGASGWYEVAVNGLNSVVINIQPTAYGKVLLTGGFTALSGGQNYSTYIDTSNPATYDDTNLTGMSPFIERNCSLYTGFNWVFNSGTGVWVNTAQTTWTTQGNPLSQGMSGDPAGIQLFNGTLKVGTTNTTKIYTQITLTDSCNFQGLGSPNIFKYHGLFYTTFTLSQTDIAQQFIAEPNCGYWVPIGGLVGTFS